LAGFVPIPRNSQTRPGGELPGPANRSQRRGNTARCPGDSDHGGQESRLDLSETEGSAFERDLADGRPASSSPLRQRNPRLDAGTATVVRSGPMVFGVELCPVTALVPAAKRAPSPQTRPTRAPCSRVHVLVLPARLPVVEQQVQGLPGGIERGDPNPEAGRRCKSGSRPASTGRRRRATPPSLGWCRAGRTGTGSPPRSAQPCFDAPCRRKSRRCASHSKDAVESSNTSSSATALGLRVLTSRRTERVDVRPSRVGRVAGGEQPDAARFCTV
jgi:hypothetical protein